MKKHDSDTGRILGYKQDKATSCPNRVTDAELAATDMTLERFTVMNSVVP